MILSIKCFSLRLILSKHLVKPNEALSKTASGVFVPFCHHHKKLCLLYTKRAESLKSHTGQIRYTIQYDMTSTVNNINDTMLFLNLSTRLLTIIKSPKLLLVVLHLLERLTPSLLHKGNRIMCSSKSKASDKFTLVEIAISFH